MPGRLFWLRPLLAVLFLATAGAALAQSVDGYPAELASPGQGTRLRIAHLAPFAGTAQGTEVSVTVNGQPVASALSYGEGTDYVEVTSPAAVVVTVGGSPVLSDNLTLSDGDYSLAIVGDQQTLPLNFFLLRDNAGAPPAGRTVLRVAHASPFAATKDESRVDVCTQDGKPFDNSANGMPYRDASIFKSIPAGTYDLKITRADAANPCGGAVIIDPPPIEFKEGAITTLYAAGNGSDQPFGVFTFESGASEQPPSGYTLFQPVIVSQ